MPTPYSLINADPEHVLYLLKCGRRALARKLHLATVRKDAAQGSRLANELHDYDADIRALEARLAEGV
jgi:hypothetical protein